MRRVSVLRLIGVLSLMAGCRDQFPTDPPLTDASSRPAFLISDGAHGAGNPNFFFLPPTASDPSSSPGFDAGQFDGSQTPTVEVCQLSGGRCGAIVAAFASRDIALSLADESYSVNWHTRASRLDPAFTYRIRVLIGTLELGFADVKVANNGRDLKSIDAKQYIALINGGNLPIKFRIENDALPGTIEIDDVALASTELAIGGVGVSYTATVNNGTSTTETVVVLQGYIEQGTASRAAGGLQVTCGAGVGVLPPGACSFGFTLGASNTASGSGTLVPGPAIARFELKNASGTFDEFTVPVTLVKAVTIDDVTLSSTELPIGGEQASYVAHLSNRTAGPLSVVVLQGWIEQGSAIRAAGGLQMNCGAGIGVLPAGTCDLAFTLGASNTSSGTGTLVPGPAVARFVLQSGDGTIVYDEFTTPVTLVDAITIDAVSLSSTTVSIGGEVTYTATVTNHTSSTLSATILQGWIYQGSTIRAAGGLSVDCGAGVGELPPGSCEVSFTLGASNSGSGTGTLVPGAATARWELKHGLTNALYDVFTMAVTLQ
jgi:hypothetical protein